MNHTTGINKVKWIPLAAILGALLIVTNLFLRYAVFHEYRLVNSFLLLGFFILFSFHAYSEYKAGHRSKWYHVFVLLGILIAVASIIERVI
jgi:uncharacterized membrane protein